MNKEMNKETFVAFATQKGGVGKSTVTALVANYVHNVMGRNVAVIDCDEPQHSIAGLRDKETVLIEKNDSLKAVACEHFRKSGRKAFPIIRSNAVKALDDADRLLSEDGCKPEIVFFDLPGTLKSDGVIKTLSQMDYIFTPVSADRFVVESALQFVMMFNDNLVTTGLAKTKGISLFWTMVDGREKTECTTSTASCSPKTISVSLTRGCPTASVSAESRPMNASRCSARPSFRRTPPCCAEAASVSCRKRYVPSLTNKRHGKPEVEHGGHRREPFARLHRKITPDG